RLQRSHGRLRLELRSLAGRSVLSTLFQQGAAKARFPRVAAGSLPEGVLINTAGGVAGGGFFSLGLGGLSGGGATATTQACERVYRSLGEPAAIDVALRVEAGGRLEWLPQETILFDRGRLARRIAIDVAPDATLLAVEAVVFGRTARGETVRDGLWRGCWRVRRGGPAGVGRRPSPPRAGPAVPAPPPGAWGG